ncbi:MAG: aspartate/glutamate racemase family protein [Lawsonibacter sp.]|jgi:aspartate racemase
MPDYRLGVLGGMGPQATNTFYQFVIDRTDARTDQEHVNALILSDSGVPDRTGAILGSPEQREAVYQRLLSDAKLLEQAGCTVLAVPCNTSHYFLDQVQKEISIPILHMIRETAKLLSSQGRTRPGILATDGTISTGLYQKEFAALGIQAVVPSLSAQKQVMSLIYDDVKAGRDGDPEKFAAAHQDLLAQGCDCGVLACTELSVFAAQHHLPPFYTDAMAVLAERAVQACHRPLRTIFIK